MLHPRSAPRAGTRRRPALAALVALCLAVLAAVPQPAAATITPDPSAGWHGRAVARPHDPIAMSIVARGWEAGPVRRGTGLISADGSRRVREVQRALRRLGYRPGRVDGRFGSRTESAVRWFQIKHGIPAVGVVGAGTLTHLRERTAPRATAAEPGSRIARPTLAGNPVQPPAPTAAAAPAAVSGRSDSGPPGWAWPAGLVAVGLLVAGSMAARRGRRRPVIVPVTWPLWAEGRRHDDTDPSRFSGAVRAVAVPREGGEEATHYLVATADADPFWVAQDELDELKPSPAEPGPSDGPTAIGYVQVPPGAGSEQAFRDHVTAIEAECRRRGWQLEQVVRETEPSPGSRGERRGLVHALERIADAEAGAFVVADLRHLTRSASELSTLIEWFADSEATLVALDVGLDTANAESALTRRAIASIGAWETARELSPEQSDLLERIVRMRADGLAIDDIASALTTDPPRTTRRRAAEIHNLADARRARHHTSGGPRHGRSA